MLRKTQDMFGFALRAVDGDIGQIDDFYFDDESWRLRYLVVKTGSWLLNRRVLISPLAMNRPLWEEEAVPVDLTKKLIQNSPDIDLDKPVSRQAQSRLNQHYGWADFWTHHGSYAFAPGMPGTILPEPASTTQVLEREKAQVAERWGDPHLRSIREVTGYHIQAKDGEIGHVDDFFVSEKDWIIRYILVDTRNWLPGRKVLVAPDWIAQVNWRDSKIYMDVSRQRIEDSPEYDPSASIERGYESRLYEHYGHPGYWI